MIKKIKNFMEYFKYLRNPINGLLFKFKFKSDYEIKIKGVSKSILINDRFLLNKLMNILPVTPSYEYPKLIDYISAINNDDEVITIKDIKFINIYNSDFKKNNDKIYEIHLEEFFTGDDWDMIDFNNRFVIDIGGNVADTPLEFSKKGANVISFEPVTHLYELGLKNISLNQDLKNRIKFINKAVGGKRGKLNISDSTTKTYASSDSYEIDIITVEDILDIYGFPADILKMDCEGCEFGIILNNDLSMFKDIIFEHHASLVGKNCDDLIKKLDHDGFKINCYSVAASKQDFNDIGIIHAFK